MKKILSFALLIVAFVSMNAQNYLFDGIYSGMTSEDYVAYCNEYYESSKTGYLGNLDGNFYILDPLLN
ncbi:MAG: hypothetical protein PHW83_10995, partial [Bacteroidales bacterium]|nr:hypothetical protein [Bacteroidales bacterium]